MKVKVFWMVCCLILLSNMAYSTLLYIKTTDHNDYKLMRGHSVNYTRVISKFDFPSKLFIGGDYVGTTYHVTYRTVVLKPTYFTEAYGIDELGGRIRTTINSQSGAEVDSFSYTHLMEKANPDYSVSIPIPSMEKNGKLTLIDLEILVWSTPSKQ